MADTQWRYNGPDDSNMYFGGVVGLDLPRHPDAHPRSPLLARPARPAAIVELEAALPLGVQPETSRRSTTIRLSPGTMLFFYTDGLVERRDDSLDVRLKQLCAAVSADEPLAVCHRVMGLLVGAHAADDDLADIAHSII